MKEKHVFFIATISLLLLSTYFFAVNTVFVNPQKQTLKILCATSLLYPMEKAQTDFEKAYPNIDVEVEGHGSIQVIRQVTELGSSADLLMVADYSLIPTMMYPTKIAGTNNSYAKYYIRFATNELVLAYTASSKHSPEINSSNWYSILSLPDVKFGFANPQLDSLGYRALIAIQLAELHYGSQGLFHDLITTNFNPPISSIPDGSNYTIIIPETQQPVGAKISLRASEVDLIALLQSGNLDYCFIYMSNAKQYGFQYVTLPSDVNLGSLSCSSFYEKVHITYEQQRFATVNLDRNGETIYYGLTVPSNAPQPDLATKFIQFLLNGTGKDDFSASWQQIFTPSFTDNPQAIKGLQQLIQEEH